MQNIQCWVKRLCGTSVTIGDAVRVFDNTLPGYNVSAADFPNGGRVTKIRLTGKPPPVHCEVSVRAPIGGTAVKVLTTGFRMMYVHTARSPLLSCRRRRRDDR